MLTRYDLVAELTGVAIAPLEDMYEDEVLQMKGLVFKYVQAARAMQKQLEATTTGVVMEKTTGVGIVPHAAQPKFTLTHTADGFPLLPLPMNTNSWLKKDWEKLYMEYMNCHYSEFLINIGECGRL